MARWHLEQEDATNNKGHRYLQQQGRYDRGAPGITSNTKLLGAKGIAASIFLLLVVVCPCY